MPINIEKGVPLPPPTHRGRKPISKYPFEGMAVGDSFLIPAETPDELRKVQSQVGGAISHFRRQGYWEWRFATRQLNKGLRVWRIQ